MHFMNLYKKKMTMTIKYPMSINVLAIIVIVFLSTFLIAVYSFLSAIFFNNGAVSIIRNNITMTFESYLLSVPESKRKNVNYFSDCRITRNWRYMPTSVKRKFPEPIVPSKELHIVYNSTIFASSGQNYFVMAFKRNNVIYYTCQWISFRSSPGVFGWNSTENIRFLIVMSCLMGIVIAIVLWGFIKLISKPMFDLNKWTKTIGTTLNDPIPDFLYTELNELASLIHASMILEQKNIEKDRQFLQFASHELRTPITIIAQNIEILKRIATLDTMKARHMETKAVNRLERASCNMKNTIETLLWMGREDTNNLPVTPVRLDLLIDEVTENLLYLLKDKDVKIDVSVSPITLNVVEPLLHIILENLVRNAFFHTSSGVIKIHQRDETISIVNDFKEDENMSGFGFGLKIASSLVDKMNWKYKNESFPGRHRVILSLVHPGLQR